MQPILVMSYLNPLLAAGEHETLLRAPRRQAPTG